MNTDTEYAIIGLVFLLGILAIVVVGAFMLLTNAPGFHSITESQLYMTMLLIAYNM